MAVASNLWTFRLAIQHHNAESGIVQLGYILLGKSQYPAHERLGFPLCPPPDIAELLLMQRAEDYRLDCWISSHSIDYNLLNTRPLASFAMIRVRVYLYSLGSRHPHYLLLEDLMRMWSDGDPERYLESSDDGSDGEVQSLRGLPHEIQGWEEKWWNMGD
jgi:hypothetical protein